VGASLLANAASGARIRLQAERRPAIFPQQLRNQLCAVSLATSGAALNLGKGRPGSRKDPLRKFIQRRIQ